MEGRSTPRDSGADALSRAIESLGSQMAASRLLGVTQGAVSKWLRGRRLLPAEHVLKVEQATGISRHDLRPDLYPREPIQPSRAPFGPDDMEPAR